MIKFDCYHADCKHCEVKNGCSYQVIREVKDTFIKLLEKAFNEVVVSDTESLDFALGRVEDWMFRHYCIDCEAIRPHGCRHCAVKSFKKMLRN